MSAEEASGESPTERELDAVREGFVDLWGQMARFWGVSPATARVHAFLLGRESGEDAEAIAEALSMSRGAVSMACRELSEWGLIREERSSGSRRTGYRAETDHERVIRSIVANRKRREWDPILARLGEWIPRLAALRGEDAAAFRNRLEAVAGLVGLADSMAESFLRGGIVPKLGLRAFVAAARRKGAAAGGQPGSVHDSLDIEEGDRD